VDVKKLARIPAGGGHRVLGRAEGGRHRRSDPAAGSYDYVHPATCDHSRVAYAEVLPDERGETCASFLLRAGAFFAEPGVRIREVMTDEALSYTRSAAFSEALGARHVTTGPYNAALNGKAERFGRTLVEEWASARLYRSNEARARALPWWLYHYNHRCPHTALGGLTPMQVLVNNVGGNHT
jgi:transposase InsO family protein